MTVVRHSRECLTTVVRHSCEHLTTVRYSCEHLTTVVRHLCECLTTFVRILISFISPNFKSRNGLIYGTYLSHCAYRGNFLAMCLRTSAKGWRWAGYGFPTYAMTWRRFCDDFCCTKKNITCLKLWRTIRDEIAMHERTSRYHVNVSRQFAMVWRIDSQTHRELVASQ